MKFITFTDPTEMTRRLGDKLVGSLKTPVEAFNVLKNITGLPLADGKPAVIYKSDLENYKALEYWASPDETIERGAGDCEDISFLIASILNGLPDHLRPENVCITVGKWFPHAFPLIGAPPLFPFSEYHAWTEAELGPMKWVIDGVGRYAGPLPDARYEPLYSLYPDRILMRRRVV